MVFSFRPVPKTGVIFVVEQATKLGFSPGNPDWANLGQGQPEAGPLPDALPRCNAIHIDEADHEYAPVPGLLELRQAVATMYNRMYRQNMSSQYGPENVAICGGGRMALTRIAAALGPVNLGHFLPDYTAYEELLDVFRSFHPIPILIDPSDGKRFDASDLRKEILGRGLGALLLSNPCNPTGRVLAGDELCGWVQAGRELDCTLIFDEFYSHYIWDKALEDAIPTTTTTISAAQHVDDVNQDPIVLVNGLTKNWRYPGWRVCWAVGPKELIETVSSAGSFLDGGAARPMQRAALSIVNAQNAHIEARAVVKTFAPKRAMMLQKLQEMGIVLHQETEGTFYAWGDVGGLPPPLNDGMGFFQEALKHKVIVVPGEFFDVNPGQRRPGRASRFRSHIRFSFGPDSHTVQAGLDRLGEMIHAHKQ